MADRPYLGPLSDPQVRYERASRAGRARTGIDYYICKLVDAAPPLTAEQRDRLALLLRGSDAQPRRPARRAAERGDVEPQDAA